MNERIKELAIQAGARFEFLHVAHYDDFDYTTFAELLIRECSDIFVELRTRPADLAVKDVKKHFGVGE